MKLLNTGAMSIEEGLKSFEPNVIKIARGAARTQVTRLINKLKDTLKYDKGGTLIIEKVNRENVEGNVANLDKYMDNFVDLHSRYSEVREKDSDGLAEAANQTNESLYFKKVEDDYNSCMKYMMNI